MAVQIETTQNVVIEQEPAGLGLRTAGYAIDIVILSLWCGLMIYILISNEYKISSSALNIAMIGLVVIPFFFYDLLFELFNNGQSPAKMILGIKVVNLDGTKPSFGNLFLRWLFRPIDFMVTNYILALIMVLTTKNQQRLGDYVAGTTVINLRAAKRDKDLSISDLTFPENYQVTFPDILVKLTDKDIRAIEAVINDIHFNEPLIDRFAYRVKDMTGYTSTDSNTLFLRKIVKDYRYLSLL
ncbi:MAG: RDD family protein [Dysgonomonas sp.]